MAIKDPMGIYPNDEQAQEILEDLADWYENPQNYSMQDFEDIFQDRDPFEFL